MKKIIFAVILIIMLNAHVYAEHEDTVLLDNLIDIAIKNNPDILAAKHKWASVKASIIPARTWDDPKFGIMWELIPEDKLLLSDSQRRLYSITQMIPFPGKLSLKGRITGKTTGIYENMYKSKELEIISMLKKAYLDYFYINKSIDIYQESSDLLTHFSKVAEQKYAVGKARQIDVLKAQVELSKIYNTLITLKQHKKIIQAEINKLLNRSIDEHLGDPVEPDVKKMDLSVEQLGKLAIENRPEILAAQDGVARSEKLLSLSKMQYMPDFIVAYKHRTVEGSLDTWDANLSFNLPLYFWKQSKMVKEKRFEKAESESKYESVKNLTLYNIKSIYVEMDTHYRLLDLYRTNFLPQAEQALKIAETAYKGEKIGFLDLLDSERSLLNFKLEYFMHIVEYKKGIADLERNAGIYLNDYEK
ncbi:MAG: TolC family protein [Elusimicrobia bacterium]|nr:TolC family protein [Elusimicrobiota bacterium]